MSSNKDIEKTNAIETFKHWIEYEKANKNKIHKADELIEIQETVLEELETYKKIAENIANTLSKEIYNKLGIRPRIEDLIEVARKEVEQDV